jgi:NADH-quinone oxidoreductase subunit N
MILISSNNLMSMYLGIELQSLSLYVLATIKRDSIKSAESGVKYFVLGALSSGILLYGCSLIYGFTGNTNFDEIRLSLLELEKLNLGILFGLIFVLVGLSFKISAVPFHMWTPDVYEGAPTAITAFFAIVSKLSALGIIYRLCLEPFGNFVDDWRQIIIFLSVASMFVGAIAAIIQTNLKRLLAYSSIGHIGYLLIGLASANSEGIKGLLIYTTIYLLMNIAIFTVILSLRVKDRYIEYVSDLSGISKKRPIFSLCIAVVMFSMAGIPPFAGFFGKFYIFMSAIESGLIFLAILGVIASVISAYYYLMIIKVMYFDELFESYQPNLSSNAAIILLISVLAISLFILYPSLLINISSQVSNSFF